MASVLSLSRLLKLFKRLNLSSLPAADPGSGKPWLHGSGSIVVGAFNGGSGAVAWGAITGTLSAQTDLQNALNGKAATVHNHDSTYVLLIDARLTDARTPTAHAASHAVGGSDALSAAQVRAILGVTTLSGNNTGDQDLSAYVPYNGATAIVDLGGKLKVGSSAITPLGTVDVGAFSMGVWGWLNVGGATTPNRAVIQTSVGGGMSLDMRTAAGSIFLSPTGSYGVCINTLTDDGVSKLQVTGRTFVTANTTSVATEVIKAVAAQTAPLTEWRGSDNVVYSRISTAGRADLYSAKFHSGSGVGVAYVSISDPTLGVALWNSGTIIWSTTSDAGGAGSGDVRLKRPSSALFRVEADNGLEIRNLANSAFAAIACGNLTSSGLMCAGTYTVGTLPSASANAGKFAEVTDSTLAAIGNYGATVTGGGTNRVPVRSNGTNWVIG